MDLALFQKLYRAGQELSADVRREVNLAQWFTCHFPPVVGFGLPTTASQPLRIATVALNPSKREFTGKYLPECDDVNEQWNRQTAYFERPYKSWFDKSEAIVKALAGGRLSHYMETVPHLDLLPLASEAFDSTYDKRANGKQRQAAISLLSEGLDRILLPVLSDLAQHHGLTHVLLYGYGPQYEDQSNSEACGSVTMRELFCARPILRADQHPLLVVGQVSGKRMTVRVARGRFVGLTSGFSGLHKLTILFMSKGPSYPNPHVLPLLTAGAQRMRDEGWFA